MGNSMASYERKNMAFSYWESKQWLSDRNLVVVGGGIVGLSAALRVRELHPNWKITVIERHPFGGGGSTRNAGFACFGSATELREDRITLGDTLALELVQKRWTGLQLLRKQLGDQALGYRESGSVELFLKGFEQHSAVPSAEELEDLNRWIAPVTGTTQTFENIPSHQFHGMDAAAIEQVISSPLEGCIDTGLMMQALQSEVHKSGIDLVHGCHVTGIENGSQPRIRISETAAGGTWFETERLLLTTNAFARELLDDLDVHPATNLVLVTEPLQTLPPQPTVHIDAGYVYARSIENRLLIGGGRHWGIDAPEALEARLLETMQAIWPESKSVNVDHRWTGVLGIGQARLPIVQAVQSGIHVAVRLGGMGVAMGMQCGQQAAALVAETSFPASDKHLFRFD